MSIEENVQTLTQSTSLLGTQPDAFDTLDSGFLLLQNLSSDAKLCEKVAQKLTEFGALLTAARDVYKEASGVIKGLSEKLLSEGNTLRARFEEHNDSAVVGEMENLKAALEAIDLKFEDCENAFARLESWGRSLDVICAKHGRAKTAAGGVFIASGCLALTISAATFFIKCAVQTTGGTLSPAAALIFRFSPLNTALAAGIVTLLGVSDTRHSHRYSRLTVHFRDFADDLQKEISKSRAFRTRIKSMRHAVDDLSLAFNVTKAVKGIDSTTWNLLLQWIPIKEQALKEITLSGVV